ncbi:uncharacterized protein BHQ10_010224 [Talaromyces amestolkiae]|uniref:Aldehyde dehydrogenase domain-containing protein n=1 Tax=Talaromyces amestolkiae TaxID=1196081 RepID=A0A364LEK0_TALAM|nr:uncharacterized protein BHQ10_010224 [Talaromyces amestolkiae]RAO74212.1 hypothetical protein BHQ10_010224 [Talaromyces amestolkiae]
MAPEKTNGEVATIPLIINNELVITENLFEVRNPATGKLISQCAGASVNEANLAVTSAKAAFLGWKTINPYKRRAILSRAADVMLSRKEELIQYQMEETGAARMFVEMTFHTGVEFVRDFAAMIPSIEGRVPTVSVKDEKAMVLKQPYGVILGIAPWNAPYILGIRAVALPLAAGNTVILKGSELSPKCFWALGDVFREAGLPAGCLNVIYHQPSEAVAVTNALIAHPDVRKISFTGSTNVGAIIASAAGRYIKPVLLELGEKLFGKKMDAPVLVNASAVNKNRDLVHDALSKGADIVYGNPEVNESSANGLRPVVVGNITKEMNVYHTESFGPTVSLFVVDNEDEAIQLANDTEYGLTSAVFTTNLFSGLRVADRIESGAVHINSLTVHDESTLPHGGWKSSGFGRFGGISGYDEWLQTKTVTWME